MNQINQGGKRINQYDDRIVIEGKTYMFPEEVKNKDVKDLVIGDGEIVVNGYSLDLQDGSFTKKVIFSPQSLVSKLVYSFINVLRKKR